MAKQTVPDLKELFKQAAEIAKDVPEVMQVAAFNRAIDLLTGTTPSADLATAQKRTRTAVPVIRTSPAGKGGQAPDTILQLMEQIDSTQHPGVRASSKVLDRALMILQIARTEHGVDGLTPGDIAKLLTDKFRLSTGDSAVRMALGSATHLVNRVKKGNAYVYRIMGPGEEHLAHLSAGTAQQDRSKPRKPQRRKPKSQGNSSAVADKRSSNTTQKVRKIKSAATPLGPKVAILGLVNAGFFSEPKTGPQVQEYLKKKRGFDLGIAQLRLAMLRLVRDGALERDENSEGQYEYKRP